MRKVLMVVLTVVFAVSGGLLLRQRADDRQAQRSQEQARETAGLVQTLPSEPPEVPAQLPDEAVPLAPLPTEPEQPLPAEEQPIPEELPLEPEQPEQRPLEEQAQVLFDVDLAKLRQTNPDVVGWISIPGTQLDYPLLQGEDNQHYLKHTWQGERNAAGSVFLECKVSPEFEDFNTIIYGHNMKNGSMFGSLRQYRTQSHYEANPCIYIVNDDGVHRYEIFAAFEAEVVGHTYRLDLTTPEKQQIFLDYSARKSVIETGIVPTVEDSVITLSTCTGNGYDYRWVVQGVLTGTFTAPEPSVPEGEQ